MGEQGDSLAALKKKSKAIGKDVEQSDEPAKLELPLFGLPKKAPVPGWAPKEVTGTDVKMGAGTPKVRKFERVRGDSARDV